jgi:tRNA-specific 2-thiouridylase
LEEEEEEEKLDEKKEEEMKWMMEREEEEEEEEEKKKRRRDVPALGPREEGVRERGEDRGGIRRTVVVGMSGGVDSAVAAYLLRARGFDVVGLHMVNWDSRDESGGGAAPADDGGCAVAEADFRDVRRTCARIGIPAKQVNFVRDYWTDVFEPMVDGYSRGVTPNPDVLCNRHIKFDRFLEYACDELGADLVATGHYARADADADVDADSGAGAGGPVTILRAGVDHTKDQSYFLSGVSSTALARVLFPLGTLRKEQVRRIARVAGLEEVADKKDSYGICFVGKRDFGAFIHEYVPPTPGDFVDVDTGAVLGTHAGAAAYTIGQGARLAGRSEKWFVVDKNIDDGSVLVAPGGHPSQFSARALVAAQDFRWVAGAPPEELTVAGGSGGGGAVAERSRRLRCQCRVRYRQGLVWCNVWLEEGMLVAEFDEPQRAIAPGQVLALYYRDDVCLGGGEVARRVSESELHLLETEFST